jgi:hypothetical protein
VRVRRPVRSIVHRSVAIALLVSALLLVPALPTTAAQSVAMPFPGGQAVRIIQGYNGGTHQGRSRYGLDLVLAGGGTSGAEVISPVEGSVSWAQGPGAGNGCVAIAFRDGSHTVMLCHVVLDRAYRVGETISRGQTIGKVGPPGTVGNNGTPHIHLELHRGGGSSSPVPFSPPEGLPLEGVTLTASGRFSEHDDEKPIVSTNRPGSVLAASALPGQTEKLAAANSAPARQVAAAAPSSQERRSQPSSSAVTARTSTANRAAVIRGTDSCLKVRKQPSADAPVVDCLPEGTEVPLTAQAGGADQRWRQIEAKGWVSSEYLKQTRAVVNGTDGCLNVREGPSTGAALLGCLSEGTSVTIAEGPTSGNGLTWYRIERAPSLEKGGWVVGQHLD